jgi:hypothetical protein
MLCGSRHSPQRWSRCQSMPIRTGHLLRTLGAMLCIAAAAGAVEGTSPTSLEGVGELAETMPEGSELTGREIYDRLLKNRNHSAEQWQRVVSRSPDGSEQSMRFSVHWKDYRKDTPPSERAADDVVSKTFVRFTHPFDMRHTAYLMIGYEDLPDLQYVYRPSLRSVQRIRLKGVGIMGSDFTFDDIAFESIDDGNYRRLPDEIVQGESVYVVEAIPKPKVESNYSRTLVYIEKEHHVLLRSRLWDKSNIEVKELNSVRATIEDFDGVWVARESTMRNLHEGTTSTLHVEKLDPNADLSDHHFSKSRLYQGR